MSATLENRDKPQKSSLSLVEKGDPFFHTSSSNLQGYAIAKRDRPGVKARDIFTHPQAWLKYRFSGDHLFGSIMMLINMYSTFELMRTGKAQKDPTRAYGGAVATTLTAWAFLCERGAKEPEGENFRERAAAAFRHPGESMVQFCWLISFPINALITGGDFYYGYQGQKETDMSLLKKIGISRLTQGANNLIINTLLFSSLLTKQAKTSIPEASMNVPDEENKSLTFRQSHSTVQNVMHKIGNTASYAYKHDKGGLIGRSLAIFTKAVKIYEAIKTIQLERTNAIDDPGARSGIKLLRSVLVGTLGFFVQSYYDYSRLYEEAHLQKSR